VRTCQPRGELESVGNLIKRALERAGADPRFYLPQRPFRHTRSSKPAAKGCNKSSGRLQGVQLELFAPTLKTEMELFAPTLKTESQPLIESEPLTAIHSQMKSSAITPENPITDADVPF